MFRFLGWHPYSEVMDEFYRFYGWNLLGLFLGCINLLSRFSNVFIVESLIVVNLLRVDVGSG